MLMVIFSIVDYWKYSSNNLVNNTIKDTEKKYDLIDNRIKAKTHHIMIKLKKY